MDKAIFFSALIIIAAFIPLFTLGGIEGRIFGPMSKTYAYAIIGALLATFTITPALASALLSENSRERDTTVVRVLRWGHRRLYALAMQARLLCIAAGRPDSSRARSRCCRTSAPNSCRRSRKATSGCAPPCPARSAWRRATPR